MFEVFWRQRNLSASTLRKDHLLHLLKSFGWANARRINIHLGRKRFLPWSEDVGKLDVKVVFVGDPEKEIVQPSGVLGSPSSKVAAPFIAAVRATDIAFPKRPSVLIE